MYFICLLLYIKINFPYFCFKQFKIMGRKKQTLVVAEDILNTFNTKTEAIKHINDLKNMTMNTKRLAFWDEVLKIVNEK